MANMQPDTPAVLFFARRLHSRSVATVVRLMDRVDSTNLEARRLIESGLPVNGTAILAREQTAGRGRLGRGWVSARDLGMYLSLIFRSGSGPWDDPASLAMVGTVAVCRLLSDYGLKDVRIKRPNDVLVGGRKLAGVLVEVPPGRGGSSFKILGVGLNVGHGPEFWEQGEWNWPPVSLHELGVERSWPEVACDYLNQLDAVLQQGSGELARAWSELSGGVAPPEAEEVVK